MPRYVNKPLIAKVHVIDANGDPVPGASVSVKVLDPAGQDWDGTWNANYYSDGVYYTEITPDQSGDWTFIFTCSNPKFSKAIVYSVTYEELWIRQLDKYAWLEPPTQNEWYTVCDIEGALKVFMIGFSQNNNETAMKNVTLRITMDGHEPVEVGRDLPNGEGNTVIPNGNYDFTVDTTGGGLLGFYSYSGRGDIPPQTFPRECISIKVEAKMNTAPGTSQGFYINVTFEAKGEVTDNLD